MTSEVNLLNGKTVGDLYDYLVAAAQSGEISVSLSNHLRTAVKKIFVTTCRPDEFWRSVLLTSVDIEARIAALRAKAADACSNQTIHVYRTRYERSVRLYLEHLQQQHASATPPPPQPALASTNPSPELLAMQKVLAASLKFQQEVLAALALITSEKGGSTPMSPPATK